MIQANELRLNNILLLCGIPTKISAGFIADYDFSVKNNFCYIPPIRISDVEPIPLTEEWLLKFGFEKNDKGNYDKKMELSFKEGYYHFQQGWTNVKVKHVHQLQNLYFALTEKELTLKS